MTFRLDERFGPRAKIQITTHASHPYLIYQACLASGVCSNTVYVQRAICAALARDLGLDYDTLIEQLPTPRTRSRELRAHPRDPSVGILTDRVLVGPGNTREEVR